MIPHDFRPINPSSNTNEPSIRKRMIDDDNTFLPPALSSYSIALLNERGNSDQSNNSSQPPKQITGIYNLDFPDNDISRNKLKNKLSVHFNENSRHRQLNNDLPYRKNSDIDNNHENQSNNISASNFSNHDISHNISNHNVSNYNISNNNVSNNNVSNHNVSQNVSNHNISHNIPHNASNNVSNNGTIHNLSNHNSLNMSLNSNSNSANTQNTTSEYENIASDTRTNSHDNNPDNLAVSVPQMPPIKRLRGVRRFGKLLGPPQRAMKVEKPLPEVDNSLSVESTPSLSPVSKPINEVNVFNRFESPGVFGAEKDYELRKRINEQKKINESEIQAKQWIPKSIPDFKPFEDSPSSKYHEQENHQPNHYNTPQQRKPLNEVLPNVMNIPDASSFRKPKLPKTNPSQSPPTENHFSIEKNKHNPSDIKLPPAISESINARKTETITGDEETDTKKKKTIGINGNQYEKLELLGRGGTSKVYKVKMLSNNKLYAIKKVTFDQFDDACIAGFRGEIDLLLKLKSTPRVVKLVDYAIGEGSIYLVMECGEIDLAHVLQSKLSSPNVLDTNFVKYHAIELLKCVEAVHEMEIVHSDLKPANFLFIRGILKIIDFGIANAVPDHTANIYRESQIGTPNYMAPEALIDINQSLSPMKEGSQQKNTWKVGKPSDVWSCGCIIYQMIYGKPPYGGYSGNQRIMAIMNPQVKIQYPTKGIGGVKVPQSAIELMQNCLARSPNDRWTIDQCLRSDFLAPKVVSEPFIRDLVHLAVNFGYNNRVNGSGTILADVYDKLVETVLKQIDELDFS